MDFNFDNEIMRDYRPLHDLNLPVDVILCSTNFEGYKLLILPVQQIIDENLAIRLRKFASSGGTILFTFRSGIKDRNNNLWLAKPLPGHLTDLIGAELRDTESLQSDQDCRINGSGALSGVSGLGKVWRDFLELKGATPIAIYEDPFCGELVGGTYHAYDQGHVFYLGTGADPDFMKKLTLELTAKSGIPVLESPAGLEVVSRLDQDGRGCRFVLNHTADTVSFDGRTYGPYQSEIERI